MAELNLNSPEAQGLALELAKYGSSPAPTQEYTTLKDKYDQLTGYNDIMKKAALANDIDAGLANLSVLPLVGNVAKLPIKGIQTVSTGSIIPNGKIISSIEKKGDLIKNLENLRDAGEINQAEARALEKLKPLKNTDTNPIVPF